MIKIRIDQEFEGPGLLETLNLVTENDAPIEVRWGNTPLEIQRLAPLRTRDVTLVVKDLAAMERTAVDVGAKLTFDTTMVRKGALALLDPSVSGWRGFVNDVGVPVSRGVLLGVADRALKDGVPARPFREALYTCLFSNVSPLDMDVLLGLKTL